MENINTSVEKSGMKTLDKSLTLLEYFSIKQKEKDGEIGISEINKTLHLGLSTIHRILSTFKSRGYIIQNQKTMKYKLGIKLFELGCIVQNINHLSEALKPHIYNLSQSTRETANLAIIEGREIIYIAKVESQQELTTNIRVGTRLPAHCTALGKAMLAYLSDNEFHQLYESNVPIIALTQGSISSLDKLKKELKKVRKQGYALDLEEYKIGIHCIGVPIFNKNGEVMAAVSITGPASRFTIDKMKDAKNQLIALSNEVSKSLY
jgi:DNA-binding IclR family transcriptional regulator